MQVIQLYIGGQRVDMFKDESVSITQSIQNVKDIGKVFTDFSKTFSLPASKTNNKIFKHYYNFDIVGGFDARFKVNATIELNNLPFKNGKIKLEGVSLKNNKPHTYKVTFFGGIVTLKDLLGEDKLSVLESLNISPSPIYDEDNLKSHLRLNPATNDLIVPLITHTQRLYYHTSQDVANTGNLHWHGGGGQHVHGLVWSELKYALRIHNIIQAIQTKYNINFSDDFFNTTNSVYYDLFMWLHRKKGNVTQGTETTFVQQITTFPDFTSGEYLECSDDLGFSIVELKEDIDINEFYYKIVRTSTSPISVQILRNGLVVAEETNITSTNIDIQIPQSSWQTGNFTVIFEFEASMTLTSTGFYLRARQGDSDEVNENVLATNVGLTETFDFIITQQIPEIKVIDFLTNLFKMFNLTSYVDDNDVIQILPLDDYYAAGGSYDITKYIDVEKSQVNIALPYKQVSFSYEDTETVFAAFHNQLNNNEFSKISYTQTVNNEQVDGSLYDIKPSFSVMKYERLIDADDNSQTSIQWGFYVDDNFEPYIGKPLIFYPVHTQIKDGTTNEEISYVTSLNADGTFATHEDIVGSINMPSNYTSFSSDTTTPTLNFNAELNEYHNTTFTSTLFKEYYEDYIQGVFNLKNRVSKVTAYLPLKVLLNYSLADRFVINGNSYKINSITTNLESGKSELELLNDL